MENTSLILILPLVDLGLVTKLVLKTGTMKVIGLPLEVPVAVAEQEPYGTPPATITTALPIIVRHDGI